MCQYMLETASLTLWLVLAIRGTPGTDETVSPDTSNSFCTMNQNTRTRIRSPVQELEGPISKVRYHMTGMLLGVIAFTMELRIKTDRNE